MAKRVYGRKIDFKSLSCAPVNEHGVIYLFGVLHESLGYKIESIQAGFPDCIARRQISREKWEEVKIEFEFKSKSFVSHKHNPAEVDVIVCWEHNWKECPNNIETIELSKMIKDLEEIKNLNYNPGALSDYMLFCREKRLQGLSFKEIAPLWREIKTSKEINKIRKAKVLTPYTQFIKIKILEGYSLKEAAQLWKEKKEI